MSRTQSERSRQARKAAYVSWAKTDDPSARTANGRQAFLERFEREVDPEGTLPPAERARRAAALRKAYFLDLAQKSAEARRNGPDAA